MPKGAHKVKDPGQGDFTLSEFANSQNLRSGRVKKGMKTKVPASSGQSSSSSANFIKQDQAEVPKECSDLSSKTGDKLMEQHSAASLIISTDELSWFEKDLSDFEFDFEDQDIVFSDSEYTVPSFPVKNRKHKKPKKSCDTSTDGKSYPLDLWFKISEYVAPEDVSIFSRICQSSHYVTHTIQFWTLLYRRHYHKVMNLPIVLQPNSMGKANGLKERVIRSLFYTYRPLVDRTTVSDIIYTLEGSRCVTMWYKKTKRHWLFFFKFQRDVKGCCSLTTNTSQYDLHNGFNDITYNTDHNCIVLRLTCGSYMSLPFTMGLMLNKVYLNVGHNMRYQKLRMVFNSQMFAGRSQLVSNGVTVVIDPIYHLDVFHWWDPKFPRN